jgi:catechol 2,3-dioxygenase-like lactoylglutathione lyase family enzyme
MSTTQTEPGLHLRPMVHVDDLAASIGFYEELGGEIIHGGRDSDWVLIGLVARRPEAMGGEGTVELTFGASMPLTDLEGRLHRAGFRVAEVTTDRTFGEQLRVRTPEGLLIKITQREPED